MKIDADSNGTVEWPEFMNYMLLENQTLSSMKREHFEYVKVSKQDPAPSKKNLCHENMITSTFAQATKGYGYEIFRVTNKGMGYLASCHELYVDNMNNCRNIEYYLIFLVLLMT